jgi:hypothetical protein
MFVVVGGEPSCSVVPHMLVVNFVSDHCGHYLPNNKITKIHEVFVGIIQLVLDNCTYFSSSANMCCYLSTNSVVLFIYFSWSR